MKQSTKFFVYVQVKPYVKRFLEINYGTPVNFEKDPKTNRFFINLLRKPDSRNRNKYPDELCKHTEEVEVLVSKDDFMRYGFELSRNGSVKFGKYFEDLAKFKARNYIEFKRGFTQLKQSICDFQELFDMPEEVWSYESIKKDIDRNGAKTDMDFASYLNSFFNRMYLNHLLKSRAITNKGFRYYEKRLQNSLE